jgi:alpha-D-xyloside xylohydrolase
VKAEFHQGGQERFFRLGWRTPSERRALAGRTKELNNTVETYLPDGADWYDFWTGERFSGGRTVRKDCPLDRFPLYVRAGSIVPMGPAMQYATERPDAPYEIRIYPGADARFTIYEDDNETYAYERGERATYDLVWDDAAQALRIGARRGSFPGMVVGRKITASLMTPGGDAVSPAAQRAVASVIYTGEPVVLKLTH